MAVLTTPFMYTKIIAKVLPVTEKCLLAFDDNDSNRKSYIHIINVFNELSIYTEM